MRPMPLSGRLTTKEMSANRVAKTVPGSSASHRSTIFLIGSNLTLTCTDRRWIAATFRCRASIPRSLNERIYGAVRKVLDAGLTPIICGGDRSISIPAAKALSDHLGQDRKMGYMHLGAHLDMADTWAGEQNVSTCALARITELENLNAGNVAHIGARNSFNPKDHIDLVKHRGIRIHPMFEVLERGIDDVMDEAVASVWDGTDGQYLSFNFNVMDSSAAPGVTSTESGGLESREIMRVAAKIAERGGPTVVDVTELCPMFDISGSTSRMAVCVVLRIMAGVAVKNGNMIDERDPAPRMATRLGMNGFSPLTGQSP